MLHQYLAKKRKILRGWRRGKAAAYDHGWWDREFYQGVSDRETIWSGITPQWAAYHYASIEALILRRLRVPVGHVCDLGSGAGHWLRFYRDLGADSLTGIDVSAKSAAHLREAFPGDTILHGGIAEHLAGRSFDTISAIGVMFHLVDDAEWEAAVAAIGKALNPGGQLIVGGHFGWLNGIDVQFNPDGTSNKRLRSLRHWKSALARAGLGDVRLVRNHAYLFAGQNLPEANLLFATRS